VAPFNSARENKSLNIFNSKAVLADRHGNVRRTRSASEFVAHEYFHKHDANRDHLR